MVSFMRSSCTTASPISCAQGIETIPNCGWRTLNCLWQIRNFAKNEFEFHEVDSQNYRWFAPTTTKETGNLTVFKHESLKKKTSVNYLGYPASPAKFRAEVSEKWPMLLEFQMLFFPPTQKSAKTESSATKVDNSVESDFGKRRKISLFLAEFSVDAAKHF